MSKSIISLLAVVMIGGGCVRANSGEDPLRQFFGREEYTVFVDVGRIDEDKKVSLAAIPVDPSDFLVDLLPEEIVAARKFAVFREEEDRIKVLLRVDGREITNSQGDHVVEPQYIADTFLAWGLRFTRGRAGYGIVTILYVENGRTDGPSLVWNTNRGEYELYIHQSDYR